MGYTVVPLAQLTDQLERLPGVGHKSAQRLAYHLLNMPAADADAFIASIRLARDTIHECAVCHNLADSELCPVCSQSDRDKTTICVVEDPRDLAAFERTREYTGTYHVLHGVLSPMKGIGPEQLRVKELLSRVAKEDIAEIIMATNPTVEGEATAMYLGKLLRPFGVKLTRLAYGIPMGGDLEYADDVTLRRSLEGRQEL
ncbi:MAG: recombination protein RecR [Ruminococcaceae bacterium]|nr:recombination protein RecR [Oscillospiraceae bacterium]MBQ2781280.1 recombination protein RecR [Clostridia bacterium]MBQ7302725.1 recombination protein RecR [Clostridia bacterium]